MAKLTSKDLPTLMEIRQQPDWQQQFKEMGQLKLNPLLDNDFITPLSERGLDFWMMALDNLHNMTGSIRTLVNYERTKSEAWRDTLFLCNVAKYLHHAGNFIICYTCRALSHDWS